MSAARAPHRNRNKYSNSETLDYFHRELPGTGAGVDPTQSALANYPLAARH